MTWGWLFKREVRTDRNKSGGKEIGTTRTPTSSPWIEAAKTIDIPAVAPRAERSVALAAALARPPRNLRDQPLRAPEWPPGRLLQISGAKRRRRQPRRRPTDPSPHALDAHRPSTIRTPRRPAGKTTSTSTSATSTRLPSARGSQSPRGPNDGSGPNARTHGRTASPAGADRLPPLISPQRPTAHPRSSSLFLLRA